MVAVNSSPGHTLRKLARDGVRLVEGRGVEGDSHAGRTVIRVELPAPPHRRLEPV